MHAQLSAKYPGVIVPPLPEKQSATVQTMRVSGVGFSAEWLEERRSQLQRFVQRVVRAPPDDAAHGAPSATSSITTSTTLASSSTTLASSSTTLASSSTTLASSSTTPLSAPGVPPDASHGARLADLPRGLRADARELEGELEAGAHTLTPPILAARRP